MEHLIKFGRNKDATIFSDIAEQAAKKIKANSNTNKQTQLRKFYDELNMWNDRVQLTKENRQAKFDEVIPFIKMMKAKVAYAHGRKYIDDQFLRIFSRCIDQITSVDTLKDAKLFMEAVMGYCKLEEIQTTNFRK
ncbi:type III-A CRISPR-associated protein Csm2 [Pasteurella multocida]|uniref:type III-A CRISPR-associated protein Csm2 n=1 Tax=Pasteurella multocida TaxID=747 RepID=UPI000DF8C71F|nr:type III-A CRISPR-associated protein Csm2 [Pasteurella multocida]MCL7785991.1 type III-A CRISPR-associated protein Csm2 [Pasteurella multocida]MCL7794723.1 type III-A CRISPR-associated protein Csm2 [Pasteurella multocida]MEB3496566.1 type III-A CRISPR-associated protein Csm2 [Pasteurella multocida]MEB3501019.1 type III-A CRISPR-associated protein Csm2 [Pasteurella multocida]URI03126.1 type III-A CRISPR-associated protein Csm2 [Pasteurella multocida]